MANEQGKNTSFSLGAKPDANSTAKSDNNEQSTLLGRPTSAQGDQRSTSDSTEQQDKSGDVAAPKTSAQIERGTVEVNEVATPPKAPVVGASTNPDSNNDLEIENSDETKAIQAEFDAQNAVNRAGVANDDGFESIYSSAPTRSLRIGRFEFVDSTLRLNAEDNADFEKLMKGMPPQIRNQVRKLDIGRVKDIVESRRAATQQFDSSLGRDALAKLHQDAPTVGTQDIAHAARPQQDHNVPVIPTPSIDPEGKTGLDYGAHTSEDGEAASEINGETGSKS